MIASEEIRSCRQSNKEIEGKTLDTFTNTILKNASCVSVLKFIFGITWLLIKTRGSIRNKALAKT